MYGKSKKVLAMRSKKRGGNFMYGKSKKVLAMIVVFIIALSLLSGCGKKDNKEKESSDNKPTSEAKGDPIIIKFGTYSDNEHNPEAIDEVTGKPLMEPEQQFAGQKAMEKVLDEMNVKVKWVKYTELENNLLLKTVLANDPFCDVALVWAGRQGKILRQNVWQQLDDFAYIFSDEDDRWMLQDKMYGHYYFLNYELKFMPSWGLVYNISYLQKADTLKENGKTILPTDIWKQGDWTWSAFEEYLYKAKQFYENKKAPIRPEITIAPYTTDGRYTVFEAIHSNGGAIYGAKGFSADSPETKEGVKYVENLMSKNLMTYETAWMKGVNAFIDGETVFTNMPEWKSSEAGEALAERGEAMGIVPFPRPDDLAQDDPRYQQLVEGRDTVSLVKGISKEKTETALKAYRLYCSTMQKTLGNGEKALDYLVNNAEEEAVRLGFDVTNETYGKDVLDAFKAITSPNLNEYFGNAGWGDLWQYDILRDSILGLKGLPKYEIAIEENKNILMDIMNDICSVISSDKMVDNVPPNIQLVGKDIAFAKGTDPTKIDWSQYLKASDGIDGEIAPEKIVIDVSKIDFNKAGKYDKSLNASVKDEGGNEKKVLYPVVVYDPENKIPPTLEAMEDYRKLKRDEDVSKINWGKDFIKIAVSADGYDLKKHLTANVSSLDVTKPGTYDVVITVTDYVGNKAEIKIPVSVE